MILVSPRSGRPPSHSAASLPINAISANELKIHLEQSSRFCSHQGNNLHAAARSAGSLHHSICITWGFARPDTSGLAAPQATCCHPLRGLLDAVTSSSANGSNFLLMPQNDFKVGSSSGPHPRPFSQREKGDLSLSLSLSLFILHSLKTRNSKLETQNSKLETRNSKLETRNSKPSLDYFSSLAALAFTPPPPSIDGGA